MPRMKSMLAALSAASVAFVAATASFAPVIAQDGCGPQDTPADPPAVAGGNAALSAEQPGPAMATAPSLCWIGASGDATIGGRVVVTGDIVATLSDDNRVVAFDTSGAQVWSVALGQPGQGIPGGLTTDGELIIAAGPSGLLGLAIDDGAEAWSVTVDGRPVTGSTGAVSPAIADATVYAVLDSVGSEGSVDRTLVALDAATGAQRWASSLFGRLPAGPVSADASTVALWDGSGTVMTFEPDTGALRWQVGIETLGIAPAGPISMADGLLVVMLATGEVVALSLDDGSERWRFTPEEPFTAAVTLQDDTLYVNAETELYAVDASTGEPRWSSPIQERPSPFEYRPIPALADGLVIVGTSDVNAEAALIAFDSADGSERWRTTLSLFGALLSPVATGGRVYAPAFFIDEDGGLVAFGTS